MTESFDPKCGYFTKKRITICQALPDLITTYCFKRQISQPDQRICMNCPFKPKFLPNTPARDECLKMANNAHSQTHLLM